MSNTKATTSMIEINGLSLSRWSSNYLLRPCKHLWQRLTRGFDDTETWSLDSSLAMLILPRLKAFRDCKRGTPCDTTPEQWNIIIDKMMYSFEYHCDEDRKYGRNTDEEYAKVEEGLKLFAEYYGHLWW